MKAFKLLATIAAFFTLIAGELHDIGGHEGLAIATATIAVFCGFCALMAPPMEITHK